ncbi:NIPSNAP family protein [Micromonospora sp. NPDC005806]|uniref:NIPSNAP family protein n=1 Tax=Micromonospora sp. NPDC005806 TaxID=3364234 RepID=UPI0036C7D1F1
MILEIRTYRLRPGTSEEFVRVMRQEAAPLLARFGIQVVAAGASLVREDGHEEAYLIRAFPSLAVRDEQEEAFYGSDAWRDGPREAILSRIESYHTVVLETSEAAGDVLLGRRS